jgi:hypothetical protein
MEITQIPYVFHENHVKSRLTSMKSHKIPFEFHEHHIKSHLNPIKSHKFLFESHFRSHQNPPCMEGSPGVDSPPAGPGKLCLQDVPWAVLKSPFQLWDGSKPITIDIWGINVHNLGELPYMMSRLSGRVDLLNG